MECLLDLEREAVFVMAAVRFPTARTIPPAGSACPSASEAATYANPRTGHARVRQLMDDIAAESGAQSTPAFLDSIVRMTADRREQAATGG